MLLVGILEAIDAGYSSKLCIFGRKPQPKQWSGCCTIGGSIFWNETESVSCHINSVIELAVHLDGGIRSPLFSRLFTGYSIFPIQMNRKFAEHCLYGNLHWVSFQKIQPPIVQQPDHGFGCGFLPKMHNFELYPAKKAPKSWKNGVSFQKIQPPIF